MTLDVKNGKDILPKLNETGIETNNLYYLKI